MYDFFINRIDDDGELIVEKRTRRHSGDVTLEQYLEKSDVAEEQTIGRNGLIKIKQTR